ncbi:hypothetical protein FNW02_23960 [Komarekiella sp. 'clone 1']|uniref:Uncharacterized protein n=1 Tax=Komarekiella delphini-convector SJRDD-AB1 TaxID=2593771 RepID=A0AA40VTS0_9NOST|nr:hypothetical protein [Komarekiella delphini-convector]MBD6618796.1 hypothetical protein [Komarekiella delphini-convector SJRDD-AB1]
MGELLQRQGTPLKVLLWRTQVPPKNLFLVISRRDIARSHTWICDKNLGNDKAQIGEAYTKISTLIRLAYTTAARKLGRQPVPECHEDKLLLN